MPQPPGYEPYTNFWEFDLTFYTFKNNVWYHVKYVLHFNTLTDADQMHSTLAADRNNTLSDVRVIKWFNSREFILPELDTFQVIGLQSADFPF
jgi:hypothetical protein